MNAQVKTIAVSIGGKTKDLEIMGYGVEDTLVGLKCDHLNQEEILGNMTKVLETIALEMTVRLGRVFEELTTDEERHSFIKFFEEMDGGNVNARIPAAIRGQSRKTIAKIVRKLRMLKEQPESFLKGAVSKVGEKYKLELWYYSSENMLVTTVDTIPVFSEQAYQQAQEEMVDQIDKAEEAEVVSTASVQQHRVILLHPAFKPIIHKTAMPVGVITNSLLGEFIQEGEELTAEEIAEIQRIDRIFRGEARD